MAEKIKSMKELIDKLSKAEYQLKGHLEKAVAESTVKVHATAISKFGHYQPPIGGFSAWKKLADSTIAQKERAGSGEDPLIGHYPKRKKKGSSKVRSKPYPQSLRSSILMKVQGLTGFVGTNNPLGVYQEYGTRHIPPRPFLRPALYQEQGFIKIQFRKAVAETLRGL